MKKEDKDKKVGGKGRKPQAAGASQGFRSFREIRDKNGRMIPVNLARFVMQLAAKKKGYKAEDITKPAIYAELLPTAQGIAKDPKQLKALKEFSEQKQFELKLYRSEIIRAIKNFPGQIVITTKKGNFKVSKPKAVEAVMKFEQALRKDKTVAVVIFSAVTQGEKYFYILLK
jgi:hypothetical protein